MQNKYYLVVGLGLTGLSIARYLIRKKEPFMVFDTREKPAGAAEFKYDFPGVDLFLGELPDSVYDELKGIICSPGVPVESPVIQKGIEKQIPILGDVDCLAQEIDAPIVAITGTNGKSTVTTLVGEMTKASGLNTAVAGNIGLPVLDILDVGVQYDMWVLELSSFQLDLTHQLKPAVSTILNISPDHLDRHHDFQSYIDSKHKIYQNAKCVVYNRDDKSTFPTDDDGPYQKMSSFGSNVDSGKGWGFVVEQDRTWLAKAGEAIFPVDELRIRGRHNWMNALAACALADAVGIKKNHMIEVLKRFGGLPHRSQWVKTLNQVDWVNDSKATNVGATISAITGIGGSMQGKIVLIAGGKGKGAAFEELTQPMSDYVRSVVLIGEDADLIEQVIPEHVETIQAISMDDAVAKANATACPGDVVLLSPACASFDMFRDFNHRGDDFMAAVDGLVQ